MRAAPFMWAMGLAAAAVLMPPADAEHTARSCDIDVSFVLDRSASMDLPPQKGEAARLAATEFLGRLGDHDRSGVRGFLNADGADKGLDADHDATAQAVQAANGNGGHSSQADATYRVYLDMQAAHRRSAVGVVIVLSDGENVDTRYEAQLIKDLRVLVFAIEVGPLSDPEHMRAIASEPKDRFHYYVETAEDVRAAMDEVFAVMEACDFYIPGAAVEPSCVGGPTLFLDASLEYNDTKTVELHVDTGDGAGLTIAAGQSATHHYRHVGTYQAKVAIHDSGGAVHVQELEVPIGPCPPGAPVAAFRCEGTRSPPGLLRFRDQSENAVRWQWDLAGGHASTEQHPEQMFPDLSPRTVGLVVYNETGYMSWAQRICAPLPNRAPTVSGPDVLLVDPGAAFTIAPATHDPDGDPLALSCLSTGDVGLVAVSPPLGWAALGLPGIEYRLVCQVEDPYGNRDTHTYTIRVGSPPSPPGPVAPLGPQGSDLDSDGDGIRDRADNCPGAPNRWQADVDRNGHGNACDGGDRGVVAAEVPMAQALDIDRDGIADDADNCVHLPNAGQGDMDQDGVGDVCDADIDGDGVPEAGEARLDNCPRTPNADQADTDGDGRGDVCDDVVAADSPSRARAHASRPPAPVQAPPGTSGAPAGMVMPLALGLAVGALVYAPLILLARRR